MSKYIQPVGGLAVAVAKAASLAAPVGNAGGALITSWAPRSGAGYPLGYLSLWADGSGTLSNAALWAFDPVSATIANGPTQGWGLIASLNNGNAIALAVGQNYYQEFDLATVFTRLAVVATIAGGVNVGYIVAPVAEMY